MNRNDKGTRRTKNRGGAPLSVDPNGQERATKRVVFALTPSQFAKLQTQAKQSKLPISVLVRQKVTA